MPLVLLHRKRPHRPWQVDAKHGLPKTELQETLRSPMMSLHLGEGDASEGRRVVLARVDGT